MVELLTYGDGELPSELKCQALSFMRIEWTAGFTGQNRLRDWLNPADLHPVYMVLVEQGVLISYTGIVWKYLEHAGETYKTYGLSGVLTYPAFRRRGYGRRIVDTVTAFIRASDADICLFTCEPRRRGFYQASGWIPMDDSPLFGGPRDNPYPSDELTMMAFFSDKGLQQRASFEATPIYFDGGTW